MKIILQICHMNILISCKKCKKSYQDYLELFLLKGAISSNIFEKILFKFRVYKKKMPQLNDI